MEEKITVKMTAEALYDFTLFHTYSKFAGFLTNVLGLAVGFMGIILVVSKKSPAVSLVFYLLAAAAFLCFTPIQLKLRAKKQVQMNPEFKGETEYVFGEEGIKAEHDGTEVAYTWEQMKKVVATPKTIGFYYEPDRALIIPKEAFRDRFVPVMKLAVEHTAPGCVKVR